MDWLFAACCSRPRSSEARVHVGPRVVLRLDLLGERVDVGYDASASSPPLEIGGWQVVSERGASSGQRFTFPRGTQLAPGATASLWSGREADRRAKHPPASTPLALSFRVTRRNIWNDLGDVADLLDESGSLLLRVAAGPEHGLPTTWENFCPIGVYEPRVVLRLDLLAERVDVEYDAPREAPPLDLGNWAVVSERGDQRWTAPRGTLLPPRASLSLWSGKRAAANAAAHRRHPLRVEGSLDFVYTKRYIWNNEGDVAHLEDDSGTVVITVSAGEEHGKDSKEEEAAPLAPLRRSLSPRHRSKTPIRSGKGAARATFSPGRRERHVHALPSDDRPIRPPCTIM